MMPSEPAKDVPKIIQNRVPLTTFVPSPVQRLSLDFAMQLQAAATNPGIFHAKPKLCFNTHKRCGGVGVHGHEDGRCGQDDHGKLVCRADCTVKDRDYVLLYAWLLAVRKAGLHMLLKKIDEQWDNWHKAYFAHDHPTFKRFQPASGKGLRKKYLALVSEARAIHGMDIDRSGAKYATPYHKLLLDMSRETEEFQGRADAAPVKIDCMKAGKLGFECALLKIPRATFDVPKGRNKVKSSMGTQASGSSMGAQASGSSMGAQASGSSMVAQASGQGSSMGPGNGQQGTMMSSKGFEGGGYYDEAAAIERTMAQTSAIDAKGDASEDDSETGGENDETGGHGPLRSSEDEGEAKDKKYDYIRGKKAPFNCASILAKNGKEEDNTLVVPKKKSRQT
ncbi:hypothetical protein B484DRAFT_468095, partial [Ochromonadaceae sp. CCMP2298]